MGAGQPSYRFSPDFLQIFSRFFFLQNFSRISADFLQIYFLQIISRFSAENLQNFLQIISRFFLQIISRFFLQIIWRFFLQIFSRISPDYSPDFLQIILQIFSPEFLQKISRYSPDFLQIFDGLSLDLKTFYAKTEKSKFNYLRTALIVNWLRNSTF